MENLKIGFLLCDELVLQGLQTDETNLDLIVHPIGVGMFSDELFQEWATLAKDTARKNKTIMIGASHADGSYRNYGVSIPIAYGVDQDGEEIFIMKDDTRRVVFDLEKNEYEIKKAVGK